MTMIIAGEGEVLLRPAEDEQHQHALLQRGHDRHPRQAAQHEGGPLRLRLRGNKFREEEVSNSGGKFKARASTNTICDLIKLFWNCEKGNATTATDDNVEGEELPAAVLAMFKRVL